MKAIQGYIMVIKLFFKGGFVMKWRISMRSMLREKYTYMLLGCFLCMWALLTAVNPGSWLIYLLVLSVLFSASLYTIYSWLRKLTSAVRTDYNDSTPTLQIASETMPLMRGGLNAEAAREIAEIIRKIGDVHAVAITDREVALAFIGAGCENHPSGTQSLTQATKDALATGEIVIVRNRSELNCERKDCICPLGAAVVAPIISCGQAIGTVILYHTSEGQMPRYLLMLAQGISQLLSMQIELAGLDHQAQLVAEAKLDALQAQINPHFLFNTLNTIGMFIRTKPEVASKLLQRFSAFLRHSLQSRGRFITLEEEMGFVSNYLILEKARFREKLKIVKKIDKMLLRCKIPVLSIQPLVENAIRHGLSNKEERGTVQIFVKLLECGNIEIAVSDDGLGIHPDRLKRVLEPGFGSGSGVGLSNVHERLILLYGENSGLNIVSESGAGTEVSFRIPVQMSKSTC
jgi:LytS/YehU family sensor histidine kinase